MLDSLRAQASAALAAGVVAVLLVGVLIAAWSMSAFESQRPSGLDTAMVALAAAADGLPAEGRRALVSAAQQAGMTVRTSDGGELLGDVYTRSLEQRMQQRLAPLGIEVLAAGHEPVKADESPRLLGHYGDIVVRLRLSDGSILELSEQAHWSLPRFLLQVLPVVLVVGLGLAALSLWVARRVTAPLERFAAAAERLGRDVNAPPLEARGPRELRRAAEVLNHTQQHIQRLLDDRTYMLAAIAHDLRTPIMRLYLRAELLPDADQQARMDSDLAEMEAMIGAALAFAREETAPQPRGPVNLDDLLGRVCDELTEAGQPVTLHRGGDVVLEGDAGGLKRAFRNLIENAVRYGTRADVGWRVRPDRVEIVIEDEGPGIPESERERVFAPFYRLESSRSRESGGTGLGMTVARTAVRGHGGDIRLENRPEGGLRQIVTLPRAAAVPGGELQSC